MGPRVEAGPTCRSNPRPGGTIRAPRSTNSTVNDTDQGATPLSSTTGAANKDADKRATKSRRWRSAWRVHFYAGVFAIPFIIVMALTGLVILYTQPIQAATQGDLRTVSASGQPLSYDALEQAVESKYPDATVTGLVVPVKSTDSVLFTVNDAPEGKEGAPLDVFVDPYTGEVLGSAREGGGVVGLSNRLHGFLNNDKATVSLPTVSALWDDGAVMRQYVIGDLILEVLGVWTLVLIATGLTLWYPRRTKSSGKRKWLTLRWSKGGRSRWRDVHSLAGLGMFVVLGVTIISGLGWSTYWGPNFTALANKISPNSWTDAPQSTLGTRGDLDRLGNKIPWNTGDRPIPASYEPSGADVPAPLSLDSVVRIGKSEGMKPGFSVIFPANAVEEESGETTFGSFTLSNSWPRKTNEGRDLFLDQFSGNTLAEQNGWGYGSVSYAMDTLVSAHMGTQMGIITRVAMTALCVFALMSAFSASAMFVRRARRSHIAPRREHDVRLDRRMGIIATGMAVVFPVWALSAGAVLAFDRFVIRRTRLRFAFGER